MAQINTDQTTDKGICENLSNLCDKKKKGIRENLKNLCEER